MRSVMKTAGRRKYDRPLEDLSSLHTDIARDIVSTAGVAITPGENRRLENGTLVNAKAYDLFLRGQHSLYQAGEPALREAIVNFKQAALYDPDYHPFTLESLRHGSGSPAGMFGHTMRCRT